MGQQRYSPEFKDEAVRQVLKRGYSVKEVAERLGDIAGDYHNEVVVGCGAYLYAYDNEGTQLWTFGPSQPVNSTPALVDLDDDGLLEIVFTRIDLFGNVLLYALEGDGSMFPGNWPYYLTGNAATSAAVGDMDEDGTIEIAVVSSGIGKVPDKSLVHLFGADGTYYSPDWPVQIDTIVTCSPVMGNIAADSYLEIVTGGLNGTIYALNLAGGIWPGLPQLQGSVNMSLALAELDGDDRQEIIASSKYWVSVPPAGYFVGEVAAIDNDGTIMTGWSQGAGTWITGLNLPSPVAFNGMIVNGSPVSNIYGWRENGFPLDGFPRDVDGLVLSSLAIGDLDGDGYLDMVAATSADSVYAFDLGVIGESETPATLCWPFYRNDRTRCGCYYVDIVTDAGGAGENLPAATALVSIHPNPLNPVTTISFDISKPSHVRIGIYDVAGRAVCVLRDEVMDRGRHEVVWSGKNDNGTTAATGIYFCRLVAGDIIQTRKMTLLK